MTDPRVIDPVTRAQDLAEKQRAASRVTAADKKQAVLVAVTLFAAGAVTGAFLVLIIAILTWFVFA